MNVLFGIVIPYAAFAFFVAGFVLRVLKWAGAPVPFRTPTTCGQQKSLDFIRNSPLESPHSTLGVIGRIALEVLLFRSLFRNTRVDLRKGPKVLYGDSKWLWLGSMAFHWSLLIVILRHFRFFTNPVPALFRVLESLDGFFQIGSPPLFISSVAISAGLIYLLMRRLVSPQLRYISLLSDYVPLLLLIGIVATGCLMRYTAARVDIVGVKQLAMGLATFRPVTPVEPIGWLFYLHLFLVSCLFAYFPFSKLTHMGGVFLSPARNLPNNSRAARHVNPWDYPVKVHAYEEWEDEFREKMKAAGLPLEKE